MHRGASKRASFTKAKFEALAPDQNGWSEQWLAFWGLAVDHGEHWLWNGALKRRRPVFIPNRGSPLPANQVAWVFDLRELGAGQELRPKCGEWLCIRPDHQTVRSSRS